MPTKSPVTIRRRGNKIEVESNSTGDILAWCWIGDEAMGEKIADILSSKYLGTAAMEFREMVAADRKAAMRPPAPTLVGVMRKIFGV
jgi:hypothetical protein